jgi:hypothetical protein
MASILIKQYSMSEKSLPAVAKWADWDDLFDVGYRAANSGEAFQEWLRCQ